MSSFQNKNDTTRLYGKYRARVLSVNDPDMRGRILVECPKVLNHHELGWAESCFTPGHFFLPRKNDLVWVEFEEGDVHKPVWTGIMPTRQYVRDYLFSGAGAYDSKTQVVRSFNHAIKFYDENSAGADRMTLITSDGSYIAIDSDTGDITINPRKAIIEAPN